MDDKIWVRVAKYASYVLVMVLLYVLQTTPGFLSIYDVKPNFIIPAAVCIALCEGEFVGGLYGCLAGLLCDLSGNAIFGFNSIIVMVCCVATGLLIIYMLRPGIINFVLLAFVTLLVRGLLDYLLNFHIWGYENAWMVLSYEILPTVLYAAAVSPLAYYLFRGIYRRFELRLES